MKGGKEYKKGLWTAEEDRVLTDYITMHGKGKWNRIVRETGLKRCGKSCRLRWLNYLSPSVKRGEFSEEEDDLIIRLHKLLGNRWALIAGRLPGRTDNQVKNYWNGHLSKRLGIKKGKSKETMTNSEPISGVLEKNIETQSGSNLSELPNKCPNGEEEEEEEEEGEKVTKEGSQSALMISDINYHDESCFWFSNIINYDLNGSSFLLEPLEDYFLEFDWDMSMY